MPPTPPVVGLHGRRIYPPHRLAESHELSKVLSLTLSQPGNVNYRFWFLPRTVTKRVLADQEHQVIYSTRGHTSVSHGTGTLLGWDTKGLVRYWAGTRWDWCWDTMGLGLGHDWTGCGTRWDRLDGIGLGHEGNETRWDWGWDTIGLGLEHNGTGYGTQSDWGWDTMELGQGHNGTEARWNWPGYAETGKRWDWAGT